jgi:N,N'-diacetyllegionaminate synthase
MFGPDHKISMEPNDFKLFIKKIREAEIILGKEEKKINKVEMDTLRSTKKVFVAIKDLHSGQKLKKNMIILKSAGEGVNYKNINLFLGKKIKKKIKENNLINKKYF